jgi:hypothetical protein
MHALHGNHDAHQTAAHNPNEPLIEILRRRYALGEINDAQFAQMKRTLGIADAARGEASAAQAHSHGARG